MNTIKKKFDRYGLAEWFLLLVGSVLIGVQVYRYATNTLTEWKLETVVLAVAVLFLLSPLTLINIIRKARGLSVK